MESESVHRVPANQLETVLKAQRPVIITGLVDHWRAREQWSLDYFQRRFGNSEVIALEVPRGQVLEAGSSRIPQRKMRLAEFVEHLRAGRTDRYLGTPLIHELTQLTDDIELPAVCRRASWVNMRLWVGPAGIKTSLHHDLPDNLFVQLHGSKRVHLIPRSQSKDCYRHHPLSAVPNFSKVDAERPDYGRFPRFRRVTAATCDVGPGEVLFIPRLWWHQLRSLDLSISLNIWYASGATALAVRGAQALAKLRA